MTRTCSTAMALIFAAFTPALAQATWTYSDIDQDGNLELSSAEFEALGEELFVSWDVDADETIDEDEFHQGLYDAWDVDADEALTEAEYVEGWTTWFGDREQVAYGDLDADGDGDLTQGEFARGLGEAGLYDTWAEDGELDQEQFTAGLYDVYDADDDMAVTQAEFDRVGQLGPVETGEILGAEVVSLSEWDYDDLYAGGVSAEDFIDEMEVYGEDGEEIGDVEDIVLGPDGRILSIVAEVGGLWDIGDTHVSIPFDRVAMADDGEGIIVPLTEDTIGDYGFDQEVFSADAAETEAVTGVDDAAVARAWRATELIGDYVRLAREPNVRNYGYVNDIILREGQVAAVVVQPAYEYGGGYQAYPYQEGWDAGSPYYDLPYGEQEVGEAEPFEYQRFE